MGAGFLDRCRAFFSRSKDLAPNAPRVLLPATPEAFSVTITALGGTCLAFQVKNKSPERASFCIYNTPFEGLANAIFEVRSAGEALPFRGILVSRAPPRAEDYIHLDGGEVHGPVTVDLREAYEMGGGHYTIHFRGSNLAGLPPSNALDMVVDEP